MGAHGPVDERGSAVIRLAAQSTTVGATHNERERLLSEQARIAEIGVATLKATLDKERESAAATLVVRQEAETRLRDAFDALRARRTAHRAHVAMDERRRCTDIDCRTHSHVEAQIPSLRLARALLLPRLLSGHLAPTEN